MADELLDIVDQDDRVTGQEMRSRVHQRGFPHRGVHVFLIAPDGRLLVQQRSRSRDNAPLALDGSLSEHVKAGEDYLSAARRGLSEELGLSQIDIQPLLKFKMAYGPTDNEICLLYEGDVDPEAVRFDPVEVERIAYYNLDELQALIQAGDVPFSGWFLQLIRWYLDRPARLEVIKTYSRRRLLFHGEQGTENG